MDTEENTGPRKFNFLHHFRRTLVTGVILLVPFGITYVVFKIIFNSIDGVIQPLLEQSIGRTGMIIVPGLGIITLLLLAYLLGLLGSSLIGRKLLTAGQGIATSTPIVRAIYIPAKQLVESFTSTGATGFKRVVMIQYPRQGVWTVGFLTGVTKDENQRSMAVVYIPTSPTPQTGWVAIMRFEDVYDTNLSIREALNLVLSGGILSPAEIRKTIPKL
jgi:uncharacterized membrane protein